METCQIVQWSAYYSLISQWSNEGHHDVEEVAFATSVINYFEQVNETDVGDLHFHAVIHRPWLASLPIRGIMIDIGFEGGWGKVDLSPPNKRSSHHVAVPYMPHEDFINRMHHVNALIAEFSLPPVKNTYGVGA